MPIASPSIPSVDQTISAGIPTLSGTDPRFIPITGSQSLASDRLDAEVKLDRPTKFNNLRVFVTSALVGTNGTVTVTLMKGSTATSLAVTITPSVAANTWLENVQDSVEFAAGETACLKLVANLAVTTFPQISIVTMQRVTS